MGCACFSPAPLRLPRCPQSLKPGMDLRLLHVILGGWKLQIVVVYGLAQSNTGAQQEFNDELLAVATQRAQQVDLPTIIMGDFNADVSKLSSAHKLASRGFEHVQQLHSSMYAYPLPPTRKEATDPDTAFLSPDLLPRLHAIQVVEEPLFDAHKVVLFDLRISGNLYKQVWPKPKPFTESVIPRELLEQADADLATLPTPNSLEEWGHRADPTVDVALWKLPVSADLPRNAASCILG